MMLGEGAREPPEEGDMRRSLGVAAAAVLLALGVSLLLPIVAAADEPSSYAGTYAGMATGKNKKGTKGSSGVTVWVEDLGGQAKFTFRFDKVPVVVDATGREEGGTKGSVAVRIAVAKMGIRGNAVLVLVPKGQTWSLVAKGSGKALKYQGSGRLNAARICTGVAVPSVKDQFTDLLKALGGAKPKSVPVPAGGASGVPGIVRVASSGSVAAPEPAVTPVAEVTVEPASIIDPAEAQPPTPDEDVLVATGVLVVVIVLSVAFGVGARVRRTAVAAGPGDIAPRERED